MKKNVNTRIKNWVIKKGTLDIATIPSIDPQGAFEYFYQYHWPFVGWLEEPIQVDYKLESFGLKVEVTSRTQIYHFEVY